MKFTIEILATLMITITLILLAFTFINILIGCTYSINMMHTQGSKDMIEESQTADPNIDPNLSLSGI
ncbi:MAG TPA: hypothetical protein VHZ50_16530 [Puia sp.]|jgi:hypothetical protein|nr:hypothetical protein [Puia sp.]